MDKLQLAINLVIERAKQKRDAGAIPAFLGVRGMLALMYDRIVQFSTTSEDNSEYVLDLVVNGLFAFADVLPNLDFGPTFGHVIMDDLVSKPQEAEVTDGLRENPIAASDEEDPRWTPIAPSVPLPPVSPKKVPQYDPDEDEI